MKKTENPWLAWAVSALFIPLMFVAACTTTPEGDTVPDTGEFEFWIALVESNVESAVELADLYLDEGSEGQVKLDRFLEFYRPLRVIVGNNIGVLLEHYDRLNADERDRLEAASTALNDLDERIAQ